VSGLADPSEDFEKLLRGLKNLSDATAQEALKTLVARESLRLDEQRDARAHSLKKLGLWTGFVLSSGMLCSSVFVGIKGQTPLAIVMCGPSLVALAGIFVIQRHDSAQTKAVLQSNVQAMAAASGAP
jgi:hypothetical protein